MAVLMQALGVALIALGVALIYVPAGVILVGLGLLGYGILRERAASIARLLSEPSDDPDEENDGTV